MEKTTKCPQSVNRRVDKLRPNSAHSYLPIRSMPLAENISILQERSGGAVRVFLDIKKFPVFKVSAF